MVVMKMKDLLLPYWWCRQNIKILKFLCRRLTDYVRKLYQKACRTCSSIIFPHSTNQIIDWWRCCCSCSRRFLGYVHTKPDIRATKTPQICIFDNEKQYFCTFCTCIFHFLTFCRRSRSFYDVKWPVLQLCGRREHTMTNVQFCLLMSQALVPI